MIWLSGGIPRGFRALCGPDVGLMLHPDKGNLPEPGAPWAIDNGCFSKVRPFNEQKWERQLRKCAPWLYCCLFAVAPDVVGDPVATLERSRPFFRLLREYGYPIAFASQDGATAELIPWEEIDCLFIGGSDAWKFCDESLSLVGEAKRRGLWVHVGRIQASRRLLTAHAVGIDSADGTSLAFDPSRTARALRNVRSVNAQLPWRRSHDRLGVQHE